MLGHTRLLTLTGPGGCGKTRLAVEVGRKVIETDADGFSDGVWLVDLAQIQESRLLTQAVADALRVNSLAGQALDPFLLDFLRPRALLLILDNCEHVVDAAARFAYAALATAPGLRILATSQAPLGLSGEREWLVPSLALPEEDETPQTPELFLAFAAIRLFVERAAAARAGFTLTRENAPAVVEICRRLDGIPLAIELAAARVKMLSPSEIAARLDQRLALLTSTKRDVHSRHQTLEAALDWSYALLAPDEQRLLTRLSIFPGPWTLEAAESVCSEVGPAADGQTNLFDLISRLIDRSLVASSQAPAGQGGDETRYRLLESVRLFGLKHLSTGEQAALHDRLLDWCDRYTAVECPQVHGPRQLEVVRSIKRELPNLNAAVAWALQHHAPDARLLQGLRVAVVTAWPIRIFGRVETTIAWLEKLLAESGSMESDDWIAAQADVRESLSRAYWYGMAYTPAYEQAQAASMLYERLGAAGRGGLLNARQLELISNPVFNPESDLPLMLDLLAGYQAIQDHRGIVEACLHIANIYNFLAQYDQAELYYRQALALAQELNNLQFSGLASREYAWMLIKLNRWPEAFALFEEAHRCFETLGFVHGLNYSQLDLGSAAYLRGMIEQAAAYFRNSIYYADRSGARHLKQEAIYKLGLVALRQGQAQVAEEHFCAAIFDFPAVEQPDVVAYALRGLAAICAPTDPRQAARLVGHADQLFNYEVNQTMVDPVIMLPRLSAARAALGEADYQRFASQGARMSIRELLEGNLPPPEPPPAAPPLTKDTAVSPTLTPRQSEKARFSGLTVRERELAVMIAQGKSNPAIASQLMLSERTVTTHVTHILEKLGYSSRTQIAAWAVEKGLLKPG